MEEEDRDVLSLLETLISLQQVAGRYLDCAKDLMFMKSYARLKLLR